jgi:hypothetical protein
VVSLNFPGEKELVMNEKENKSEAESREVLCVAGGMALMLFGVGLVMTHPGVRKTVMDGVSRFLPDLAQPLKNGVAGILPDLERYLKVRSM